MVSRAGCFYGAWLAALTLLGCSDTIARTQLMLVADTDIPDLDSIHFEVSGDGRTQTAESSSLDAVPATLALVPEGANLGPLMVTARGLRGGVSVVERAAEVSFVPRQTLVVELHLLARCAGWSCGTDETCSEHGCRPRQLGEDDLSPWTGEAPTVPEADFDASVDDGGWDADTVSDAQGGNEDAELEDAGAGDGSASDASTPSEGGEDASNWTECGPGAMQVNLDTDVNHCGMCRNMCRTNVRNAVPSCEMGDCGFKCRPNFDDCDENPANGCEQSLTQQNHCGMCGHACENGAMCRSGICM